MRVLKLKNIEEIRRELARIAVDNGGIEIMAGKAAHLNIKAEAVPCAAANILKQEMLSLGGDCAIHRDVITGKVETSDVILIGNLKNLQILSAKIAHQPFGLAQLAEKLEHLLKEIERPPEFVLNCREKTLYLTERTHIMGILNVTPDSFHDGGRYLEPELAIERGLRMAAEGADIIDIGAESSRPGSEPVPVSVELERILPVLEGLLKEVNVPISIDTYKSEVAEAALEKGAHIINDISALRFDARMVDVIKKFDVPVILMHIKGTPKDMQINPTYDDLMGEIYAYLTERINFATRAGVKKERLLVDPGIGFGKRVEDNYEILRRLSELKGLGCPVLIGPSRKSFIGLALNLPTEERLEGTATAVAIGIANGAHIVRVHDVKEMFRVVRIADLVAGKTAWGAHPM